MLVWGGWSPFTSFTQLNGGGRYVFHQGIDDDGDGLSECDGDCNDADAFTAPGAPELCNERDDSCEGLVDENAAGLDSDEDGTPNACDACPAFFNPGQDDPFYCGTAEQDGGSCLETEIELAGEVGHGEVTVVTQVAVPPDAIRFETNASSCERSDPIDFLMNGEIVGSFAEPSPACLCEPPLYSVRVAEDDIRRLWRSDGTNEFGFRLGARVEFTGTYVGFVRVRIGSGLRQPATTVCLYSASQQTCNEQDQCLTGWNDQGLDLAISVELQPRREEALIRTTFSESLPSVIDLSGIEDGAYSMCVGPAGPPRLYAVTPAGALHRLSTSTARAVSEGSLGSGAREMAHDDLARETWTHGGPVGAPSMVPVDLNTLTSGRPSPFLSRESSGLEFFNGLLYSVESATADPRLLEIDPETGSSRVAAVLPAGAWAGLTYEPASDLFLSAHLEEGQPGVWTIDALTGQAALRHPIGFMPTDIEFGPEGALHAAVDIGSDTELHRIDAATGATALVGLMGVPGVTSLATVRNLPRGCMDIVKQGEQALAINGSCSSPPAAVAGADASVECSSYSGGAIRLDGTGSTDPDNDIVSYEWLLHEGTPDERVLGTGAVLDTVLPLGDHVVTLRVRDAAGGAALDQVAVRVVDTQPPALSLVVSPAILWPPDHRMVPVTVGPGVLDTCDPSPVVSLVSAISSDPQDADSPDIEPAGPTLILLRAERPGWDRGRTYTLVYQATDASGNASGAGATVVVPHDQRRLDAAEPGESLSPTPAPDM
jgi:hypothetical protein